MILSIFVKGMGITDDVYKKYDIFAVHDNAWIPGDMEKKRWLNIQVPDLLTNWSELTKSDYALTGNGETQVKHMRAYYVDYSLKLTPEELVDAEDINVSVETITDRFVLEDIKRKNY